MANYLQFDPRLPRPQAPRGLAPSNMAKKVMAGRVASPVPMMAGRTVSAFDQSPLYRHLGIPVPGTTTIPASGASGLALAPVTRPPIEQLRMPLSRPLPSAADEFMPQQAPTPVAPMPAAPMPMQIPGIPGMQGRMTPSQNPLGNATPYMPGMARLEQMAGQPLPSVPAWAQRQQVPSMNGTGTAGSANGYVSVPGARQPIGQVLSGSEMSMLNRDSNVGPYGSLGGSSSRVAGLAALAQQQQQAQQSQLASQQGGSGFPEGMRFQSPQARMAWVKSQIADPTTPLGMQKVAQDRQLAQMQTPQYIANRSRQQEYNTKRDTRLSGNRRDSALAQGIARNRAMGIPLSPAQEDMIARARGARSGNYTGPGGVIAGTGLNAPPRPFAALQPTPAMTQMTPEREQQLFGLLNGLNDQTSPAELQRIRGMVQPGELEYLTKVKMPGALEMIFDGAKRRDFNRLSEQIRRLRGTNQVPTLRPQNRERDFFGAVGSNSSVQF